MRWLKKHLFVLLLLVVFFLVLFKVIYGPGTASKMDNLFRFHNCLELLEEDRLYSQYACWHGPPMYYTYYLFKIIFGKYFALWSTVILSSLIVFMMLYLVWKETNNKKFIIPVLLYLALVIPLIADFFSFAAELVASLYMLAGIVLLMYWKSKAKPFFVSLLFTFSVLSSIVVLAPIGIFLVAYFYQTIEKPQIKNALTLIKNNLVQIVFILLPIIVLHLLFELIHPLFIRFVWLGFAAAKATNIFNAVIQTVVAFSTPNLVQLPLTAMIVIALYSLFKARNIYLTTFFFGILTFTIINVRAFPASELFDPYLIYSNKFVPFIIFFIIGFSILANKLDLNLKKHEQI